MFMTLPTIMARGRRAKSPALYRAVANSILDRLDHRIDAQFDDAVAAHEARDEHRHDENGASQFAMRHSRTMSVYGSCMPGKLRPNRP